MKWDELKYLWYSDLYRYDGKPNMRTYLSTFLWNPGFRYTFIMRLCSYLCFKKANVLFRVLFDFSRLLLQHYQVKYGIHISYKTQIQSGFYIGHYGCIVVNQYATVGKNCNISHGVTIGQNNRGRMKGYPIIGDNVYIGPGAMIIGSVNIGNNVAIGANCVVTKDAPDDAVIAGVPGRIISNEGSREYINRISY